MRIHSTLLAAGLAFGALSVPAFAQESVEAAQADTVTFELHLKKGDRFAFVQSMDMTQDIDMQGMQMSTTMKMSSAYSYDVLDVREDGASVVRTKFGRVYGSMDNPMMGTIEFDSDKAADESDNPMAAMVAGALTAMAGHQVEMTIAKNGDISELRGIDELVAAIMEANPMAAGMGMDTAGVEKQIRQNMESMLGAFPHEPVAVGASWEKESAMNAMGGMDMSMKVKSVLKRADASHIVVESELTGSMGGDGQLAQMFDVEEFKGTGTSTYDRADGLVREATSAMTMKATIKGGEAGTGGMTMKFETKIERVAVSDGETSDAPKTPEATEPAPGGDK